MRALLYTLLLSACGRVAFEPTSDARTNVLGDTLPDVSLAALCPPAYDTVLPDEPTHRYRLPTFTASWMGAVDACGDDSTGPSVFTHLVTPSTPSELADVIALNTMLGSNQMWLGLSDRVTEGTFLPTTDEDTGGFPAPGALPWGNGEPNDQNGVEDCAEVIGSTINDADCSIISYRFLCECDTYPPDPARF